MREDCVATGVSDPDVKLIQLHGPVPGKFPGILGMPGRGRNPDQMRSGLPALLLDVACRGHFFGCQSLRFGQGIINRLRTGQSGREDFAD